MFKQFCFNVYETILKSKQNLSDCYEHMHASINLYTLPVLHKWNKISLKIIFLKCSFSKNVQESDCTAVE